MCGIAGVFLRDPNLKVNLDAVLDTLLDEIDHRGGDATGFVAVGDDGVLEWQKAACDARDFCMYRRTVPRGTRALLAHTRWATQGLPAFMENNHPLRRGAFFIIHNGHVVNDDAMFRACSKRPTAVVDSEAIAASLSRAGSLGQLPAVMEEIDGMAAVAAVDERDGSKMSIARGYSSPLFVLETKRIVIFGSTKETVLTAYRKHIGSIKESRVRELAEGTCIHYEDRERIEVDFKVKRPALPKVTWKPTGFKPVVVTKGKTGATSRYDDWDEDYTDCDECGVWMPWAQVSYREDPTTGLTIARCPDCDYCTGLIDEDDDTDTVSEVNRRILENFLRASK